MDTTVAYCRKAGLSTLNSTAGLLQGQCYAISSMEGLPNLRENVDRFIGFARQHPELTFLVTCIGCGIAGYKPDDVAPMFGPAVEIENIWLPMDFWKIIV